MGQQKRSRGYQVCVHVGPRPTGLAKSVRFVELLVEEATPASVLKALSESGLTPGDFRADAVCSFETDTATAVLTYAAVVGFAQRRVDVLSSNMLIEAAKVDRLARSIKDAGKPETVPQQVQVGVVQHQTLPSIAFSAQLSAADASSIRYARRVRFAPTQEIPAAITQFLVVAGIRARAAVDRFPYLVHGDEPAPSEATPLQIVGVCLDTLRADALELRRRNRTGDRETVVPKPAPSARRSNLMKASEVSIEDALVLLGGRKNESTGLWHCPRPTRHTNGDANASMRVVKGLVRCYRCDGERVDSLRLAMDVLGLSPDESAQWLIARSTENSTGELDQLFL